eukprot:TRINITY_DN3417_c0_g1_i2.p1 TRINITY_DN3417_c0_g1~~TRINITY_DN3417_c0_g1_i2.p1  ORF type:complete len:223 (-),score=32.14 TRINITY_DN3417_c0_g1_i2:153-821(-)
MLDIIGKTLLDIPHIKRIRFATKILAVMPMKFLSDTEWTDKIVEISDYGRSLCKQVAIHTHINHPAEVSETTEEASNLLFKRGVLVRNQTVLLRTINDDPKVMMELIKQLMDINIFPYYVFQHDLVKGCEYFRTPLKTILDMEKYVRGRIAGFGVPNFMLDMMGGGGKRLAASYESYDQTTGVSTFISPAINASKLYYHFDPLPLASISTQENQSHQHLAAH